jgi:hypothetical protein
MIYFLITTSYYEDNDTRKTQYIYGIQKVLSSIQSNKIKPIIIENNGKRNTFFDDFGIDVFYTNNNRLNTRNIGTKELKDVIDCIHYYNITDNDFIVKMTGRYILSDDSFFIKKINEIANGKDIECIIRYDGYGSEPSIFKIPDCITGLIGMKCKYVKTMNNIDNNSIEVKWAEKSFEIPDEKLEIIQDKLGIYIWPTNYRDDYFLV